MNHTSWRSGTKAGCDIAKSLACPSFSALAFVGATKYPISFGCTRSLMSNSRSPETMNEQATIFGSTRDGMLQ